MLTSTPTVADPVYVKYGDTTTINGNVHILLFNAVNNVTLNQAVGIQRFRSVFKIYVKDNSARLKLIHHGLEINNNCVRIYEDNPYNKNNSTLKITVRDLPLEFNNSDLLKYFKSLKHLRLKSNVMYCRERLDNGQFSKCLNGDRFVYVEGPIYPPLPKKHSINVDMFYIFYNGQTNICETCKQSGHKSDDINCPLHASATISNDRSRTQTIESENEQNTENTDTNFVLKYECSPVQKQKRMTYSPEKIRLLREKLGLEQNINPDELSDQYKFDSFCNNNNYSSEMSEN